MRVASWNVNSIRVRAPRVVEMLDRHQIDVLAMQEIKVPTQDFPREVFEAAGYEVAVAGQAGYNGVAIASRVGIEDVQGLDGQPYLERIVTPKTPLEARAISALTGGVRVMSVYVPNGREISHPHFTYKLRFIRAVAAWASAQMDQDPEIKLAVMGDWNVAPRDEDVWDVAAFAGKTHVTRREREALAALGDEGLVEVTADSGFTYWDYQAGRFARGQGMRIDIQWASPSLAQCAGDVVVDREERARKGSSDHAALIVDYAVEGAPGKN